MCGSRTDVVLCSFAFERVHRRVPLCREHRQPLVEIDHFTRPVAAATLRRAAVLVVPAASAADRPAAAAAASGRCSPVRSVVLLPVR